MKQITQKELIDLIKDKQENAKNEYEAIRTEQAWTIKEGQNNILRQERNIAFIDAYQDLICYLQSVEIVENNEHPIAAEKHNIEAEPSIFARIRAFYDEDSCVYLDAKEIISIITYKTSRYITIFTIDGARFGFDTKGLNIDEIIEWWSYWKQN